MSFILELKSVNFTLGKKEKFSLKNINLSVPKGFVMGLIGENGAGKTTLFRLILSIYFQDSGNIKLFGENTSKENIIAKDKIGVVLDRPPFSLFIKPKQISKFFSNIYSNWDEELFFKYLTKFNLSKTKRIVSLSSGNLVKMQLAVALSHKAELLVLDEPMNYLDPNARREVLDIIREFVQDENHAVLISSHLTNDLEKICDAVSFLHKGEIIFTKQMDELQENWAIAKLDEAEFNKLNKEDYIGCKKNNLGYEILTDKRQAAIFNNTECVNASLEDIMYFYGGINE